MREAFKAKQMREAFNAEQGKHSKQSREETKQSKGVWAVTSWNASRQVAHSPPMWGEVDTGN